ncbi:MAG: HD domain-containing protein [Deltaproteobacteria bacterium]|nr:HD domain-containing protein [Deltaproteobacteria bacterium]
MKKIFVKDIKAGDRLKDLFLIAEKTMAHSQKGAPYLNIKLKDRTGEVMGKVWDNALSLDLLCKKGDIALISCWASTYKGALQMTITDIGVVGCDTVAMDDFFPKVKGDVEEMFAALLAFVDSVENTHLRLLLRGFLDDEAIATKLKRTPAAKGMHHTAVGGLLEHSLSVTRALDALAPLYPDLNRDMLITGGILHDIGKIRELSFDSVVEYTTVGRLIGHIVIGLEMLNEKLALIENFPEDLSLELRHIMLSHHGEFEFGSPKLPQTRAALIIHQIDDLDAKLSAFAEQIENDNTDSPWTGYHRLLERYIYKG